MRISTTFRDTIGPDLASKASGLGRLAPVAEAIGLAVVGIAKRSFNDEALRQTTWPAKKRPNGQPLLKYTGNLWQSLRVAQVTAHSVTVGSDRPYAAIHQLGGTIRRPEIKPVNKKALAWPGGLHPVKKVRAMSIQIPARPYFPFTPEGKLADLAAAPVREAALAKLRSLFGSVA